jgi:hypothetical protein
VPAMREYAKRSPLYASAAGAELVARVIQQIEGSEGANATPFGNPDLAPLKWSSPGLNLSLPR